METTLKFLIAIGLILLMAILFFVVKINDNTNTFGPKGNPTIKPGEEDKEIERLERAKTKAFFLEHANITGRTPNGEKISTVTMTLAVQQAIEIQQTSGPDVAGRKPKVEGIITINEKEPWQLSNLDNPTQQKNITTNASFTSGYVSEGCPTAEIDFDQLVAGNAAYKALVGSIITPATLGLACVCPSGEGWCNWSSEMFEQFIVDTDVWNLTSVEVFDILTGNLLSTSSMNQVISSPSNHILVQMSNPTVLQNLNPGQQIVVLFKWLDKLTAEQECIELFNRIPE